MTRKQFIFMLVSKLKRAGETRNLESNYRDFYLLLDGQKYELERDYQQFLELPQDQRFQFKVDFVAHWFGIMGDPRPTRR